MLMWARLWGICLSLLLLGCGYQPLARYSEQQFGERIYVDISINYRDPENSVLIKDAILRSIVQRLGAKVAISPKEADSQIHVTLHNVRFASLAENTEGFTSFYRIFVTLRFRYYDKAGKVTEMDTIGRHTFSIDTHSILTDTRRLEAIEEASIQALDAFFAKIATLPKPKG